MLFLCYVDDGIFASPNQEDIDRAIIDLKNKMLILRTKGSIEGCLGMAIETLSDATIRITKPQNIQSLIDEAYITSYLETKGALVSAIRLLTQDTAASKFNGRFHCRQLMKKLNHLEKGSRGYISFATHQCARYYEDPMESHAAALEHIVHYLM
eukprot:3995861-Ditylum_brightwellii.AAC.1